MKYAAVIFDLYGTLVDKVPMTAYRDSLQKMANTVSAPPDDFIQLWFETYNERGLGVFQSYEANIEYICNKLGVKADSSKIRDAVEINRRYGKLARKARPHAVEILAFLKERHYKTGLISDCGVEIPKLFDTLPFATSIDVAVFSCMVKMQKPAPGIYQIAAERLEVSPEECLYIGDGDSNELTGAFQIGMYPVLIRNPQEDRNNVYRTDFEGDNWKGPVITSLKEVPNLL